MGWPEKRFCILRRLYSEKSPVFQKKNGNLKKTQCNEINPERKMCCFFDCRNHEKNPSFELHLPQSDVNFGTCRNLAGSLKSLGFNLS